MDTEIQVPVLTLRAALRADSVDPETRTVEVVFSTGAPVERLDWMSETRYVETLSLEKQAIRLDRLNDGAPFLNAHSAWAMSDVLGVVVAGSARLVDGEARAQVRLSKREDVEPIWQDIRDGIIRNVSVGYRVHKYEQTEAREGKPAVRHAVDWEPYEISAVPMGADPGAHVRAPEGATTYPCLLVRRDTTTGRDTAMEPILEPGSLTVEDAPKPGTAPTERDAGADDATKRAVRIMDACEAARLPGSYAKQLIESGIPLVEAQTRILETLKVEGGHRFGPPERPAGTRVVVGSDPLENVWRGIAGALLHRVNPSFGLDDNARQYRMHSLLRAAEECLEQRGIRTRGMSKDEVAHLAFKDSPGLQLRQGLHTTSDFANILADVANKSLRRAYDEAPQTWQTISRQVEMPDFKTVKRNQIGEAPYLAKVLENGEFTRGTMAEGKEQFALSTYGKIFGITRKALVNDDLDAFGRTTMMFGRSARNLESDLVWAEVLRNANMGDGVALFHATHGNLAGSGAAIDVTTLGAGRAAMRNQKGLDARTYLNIVPRYLIVPPGKETIALQFTTQITPQQGSNVNPFAGVFQVIAEPRLEGGVTIDQATPEVIAGSATAWYLAADPTQIDIIEYGFLSGSGGPSIETRVGFDVDGLEIKARHDFAAKVIDWRGWWKNPGA